MLLAYAAWIEHRFTKLLLLTAFTVLVVRFETIILFGCILAIEVFYTRQLKLWTVLLVGIPSGILSLLTTVVFDSYMWNKLVWPEGKVKVESSLAKLISSLRHRRYNIVQHL